jgi:arginase family enzyme
VFPDPGREPAGYQDRGTSALNEYVRTKIDLDVLHPRVVLAPGAEPTLGNRVRELAASAKLAFDVEASGLQL